MRHAFVAVATLALAACGHEVQATTPIAVHIATAHRAIFRDEISLAGNVVPSRTATVGSTVAGRVTEIDVSLGDLVRAGQTIARIDTAQYAAGYEQARSGAVAAGDESAVAVGRVDAARAQLDLASSTARRMQALYGEGAISAQERDKYVADLTTSRAGLAQAQADLAASRNTALAASAGAEAAGVPIRDGVIRAPFDGMIVDRMVEPGSVVGPSSPIVTLQDDRALELDVTLPISFAASVSVGAPLAVRIDELGNAALEGRVLALIPSANPSAHSATLRIAIPPRRGLMSGMYARTSLHRASESDLSVPTSALVTRSGQSGVFVIRGDRATFIPIETGKIGNGLIAVRGAMHGGDTVVVSNLDRVTEGATVVVAR